MGLKELRLAKKILVGILGLALVIECLFPIGGFLAPEKFLGLFQVDVTPSTLFLTHVVAWCLFFVAIVCGLALKYVLTNEAIGWTLSYLLGFWWIGIGTALCVIYGRFDNLVLDALKGLVILASAYASRRDALR